VVWESTNTSGTRGFSSVIRGALVTPQGAVGDSQLLSDSIEGYDPAVAYNATTDEYLLVFHDPSGVLWIVKLDAGDLNLDGTPQDISSAFGFEKSNVVLPDVAWDAASGRWLVVWQAAFGFGSKGPFRGAPFDPTIEVYGRSFDAALNGSDLERISHEFGDPGYDYEIGAREPAVSPDTKGGGFLVVYVGEPGPQEATEERGSSAFVEQIFSRRVNGDGTVAGDAVEVSDRVPEDSEEPERPARRPDVWHDGNADQFLVSWAQDVSAPSGREDSAIEYEIFGKKVDGNGVPLEGDTRISDHAPSENAQFDGDLPAVTYDASTCDYVVSWTGEEFAEGADEKEEIWDRAYDAPPCPAGAAEQTAAVVTPTGLSRRCGSRRTFPIHLVRRTDREYEFAVVRVNGQQVNVTYGDRVEAVVNLVGLPLGRFTVDIEARLANGRTLKGIRRYFTCTKKLPPSNGLEREDAL
jgi:hypothetical protein